MQAEGKNGLFALALLLVTNIAFAAISRAPSEGEHAAGLEMLFDGVWIGSGGSVVTLIKQIDGLVILQGKDNLSTWSAKGVVNGSSVICRGTGINNVGKQFVYESTLTLKDGVLNDAWKVFYSDGIELNGSVGLEKLDIKNLPDNVIGLHIQPQNERRAVFANNACRLVLRLRSARSTNLPARGAIVP